LYFPKLKFKNYNGTVILQRIFGGADEQSEEAPSLMNNVMGVFSSVSRFMRVISKWKSKQTLFTL